MSASQHIYRLKYAVIYAPAFQTDREAKEFVDRIENTPTARNTPLVILHQTARMVWLGDQIVATVARGRAAFQVLFYLIAAETTAKLLAGYEEEGRSRQFVKRFFEELCGRTDKEKLGSAFFSTRRQLSFREAVDLLYDVRCDVVHEGRYFEFHLSRAGDPVSTLSMVPAKARIRKVNPEIDSISTRLTAEDLRAIVLRGAVTACERALTDPS